MSSPGSSITHFQKPSTLKEVKIAMSILAQNFKYKNYKDWGVDPKIRLQKECFKNINY